MNMITDWSDLIEHILDNLALNYIRRETYYHTQSPLVCDTSPSFQWYINDGFAKSWNTDIEGKSRLSIKKVCKLTGFMQDYIRFVMERKGIPIYKLNQYKEMLVEKQLGLSYDKFEYGKLKRFFGGYFISQADVLGLQEMKPVDLKKIKQAKRKKKKSKISEAEATKEELLECVEYLKGRGLGIIQGRVEAIAIKIGEWRVSAIALRHEDNHVKYRVLSKNIRYVSSGTFKTPYKVIDDNNDKLLLTEGQLEAESIKHMIEGWDLYSMANCNSIGEISHFKKYKKILVLIDADTYDKNKSGIVKKLTTEFPDKNIQVIPKIEGRGKEVDYNWLLVNEKETLDLLVKKTIGVLAKKGR